MNKFDDNFTMMCLQNSKMDEWKKKLKEYLSNKTEKIMDLYIVTKVWLDNYEKNNLDTINNNGKNNNIDIEFDSTELIRKFSEAYSIYTFPTIFVLDKGCEIKNNFKVEGKFINNILLLDMKQYAKFKLYIFFCLSQNGALAQGYLHIKKTYMKNEIIKNLIVNGPYNLIKNSSQTYMNNPNMNHNFNMTLKEYELKESNQNFMINNVNLHKNIYNINQNKNENQKNIKIDKHEISKRNLDSVREIINGNEINSEKISSDKENYAIMKKYSNSVNINLETKGELESKQDNIFNPKKLVIKKNNKRTPSVQMNKKMIGSQRMIDKFNLEKFLPNKAIHNKSTPGLIGLLNIGATCYMNATLQCFSNIGRLRTHLLNKEIYKNLENEKDNNKILSFALAEVLKNLWEKLEQRFYAPENFKKVISEKDQLFKGIAANDPKDLIIFLLQTIHKELNNPPNNKIINNIIPNENNLIEVFNYFVNDFNNNYKSIISDEFYGYTNSSTICGFCNYEINNVQIINILFFPLEEIRKFKNIKHNNVSIIDCFDYYEKIDIYPSFHCNNCKRECQAYSQNKIVFSPKTLIINLNRGKGLEFNVNIIYEEYLNLKKYIYFENSPYYYELIGVICHLGFNDEGGHFIAYCKNSENCEWYKYNDQFVTKCYFNEVKNAKLPYVLFYSFIQTS